MKKVYFLSEEFDYSRKISPATGPEHAERNDWKKEGISQISKYKGNWKIIDNRITKNECNELKNKVKEGKIQVCLVIVDPYREWCSDEYYYKMMYEISNLNNVSFLSKYEPSEIAKDIKKKVGKKRFLVYPYSYDKKKEIKKSWVNKNEKIFFSGNENRNVYPYRYMFDEIRKYWVALYGKVKKLDHPGYPDIGENKKHDIVGQKYIEEISKHQFMFISPSRCRLEFLKYGECATAGSVPVGMLPDGFAPEMRDPFVELDFSSYPALIRSTHAVFDMSKEEKASRARKYRQAMRKYRSPDRLNRKLDAFIEQAWPQ